MARLAVARKTAKVWNGTRKMSHKSVAFDLDSATGFRAVQVFDFLSEALCRAIELRVSASRSRCRNLVGLNALARTAGLVAYGDFRPGSGLGAERGRMLVGPAALQRGVPYVKAWQPGWAWLNSRHRRLEPACLERHARALGDKAQAQGHSPVSLGPAGQSGDCRTARRRRVMVLAPAWGRGDGYGPGVLAGNTGRCGVRQAACGWRPGQQRP